jgi:hypothetical protein
MANKIHQMGRIFAVVNCEGSVQADSVGIFAEEARTNRVKCSCSHTIASVTAAVGPRITFATMPLTMR